MCYICHFELGHLIDGAARRCHPIYIQGQLSTQVRPTCELSNFGQVRNLPYTCDVKVGPGTDFQRLLDLLHLTNRLRLQAAQDLLLCNSIHLTHLFIRLLSRRFLGMLNSSQTKGAMFDGPQKLILKTNTRDISYPFLTIHSTVLQVSDVPHTHYPHYDISLRVHTFLRCSSNSMESLVLLLL